MAYFSPEQLKRINGDPALVSLLYDLDLMPEQVIAAIRRAKEEERKRCAKVASHFSVKEGKSIHPDIPWEQMNETAKMAAHTTAQQIAQAILGDSEEEEKSVADEQRYCVKCGIPVENTAHVYGCDGPGDCANPAPFQVAKKLCNGGTCKLEEGHEGDHIFNLKRR